MSFISCTYPIARTALFSIDPEEAHELSLSILNWSNNFWLGRTLFRGKYDNDPCSLMGIKLNNPVGLAAGFDKNALNIDALGNLGFGFIEVGTVTPQQQHGNLQKPRILRIPKERAIINHLGFNNMGLGPFISNVLKSRWRAHGGILGINIGKNSNTTVENSANDYLECLNQVYPHADYITINISSPNTPNLRDLQCNEKLVSLLRIIKERREKLSDIYEKRVPLAVKISPNLTLEHIDILGDTLLNYGIDGVIATNTSTLHGPFQKFRKFGLNGGLSGDPIHELSLSVIDRLKKRVGNSMDIVGVGGILSGKQACEKIVSGSNVIQIYTGFIYRGPILIEECIKAIRKFKLSNKNT